MAVGVYLFGKISMAHFLITKHITKLQLLYYFTAEILGALLGSLFVMLVIGREADLGANSPNYAYPLPIILCFIDWVFSRVSAATSSNFQIRQYGTAPVHLSRSKKVTPRHLISLRLS